MTPILFWPSRYWNRKTTFWPGLLAISSTLGFVGCAPHDAAAQDAKSVETNTMESDATARAADAPRLFPVPQKKAFAAAGPVDDSTSNAEIERRRQVPQDVPGLIAFWDFQEETLKAHGVHQTVLKPEGQEPQAVSQGIFGARSLQFKSKERESPGFLRASNKDAPELSIGGPEAQVTVVAWLKRENRPAGDYAFVQAVAGVWNEHGRRQYALFLNLREGEQVGAHVSKHGGPTPGDNYSRDDAVGATKIGFDKWHCAAISYDGTWAKAFLDGVLDVKAPQGQGGANPFYYPGGLLAGNADFTVGAVERPFTVERKDGNRREIGAIVGNPFVGLLGGLAVYNRALSDEEIRRLSELK